MARKSFLNQDWSMGRDWSGLKDSGREGAEHGSPFYGGKPTGPMGGVPNVPEEGASGLMGVISGQPGSGYVPPQPSRFGVPITPQERASLESMPDAEARGNSGIILGQDDDGNPIFYQPGQGGIRDQAPGQAGEWDDARQATGIRQSAHRAGYREPQPYEGRMVLDPRTGQYRPADPENNYRDRFAAVQATPQQRDEVDNMRRDIQERQQPRLRREREAREHQEQMMGQAHQAEMQKAQQGQQAEFSKANMEFAQKLGLETHKQELQANLQVALQSQQTREYGSQLRRQILPNLTRKQQSMYRNGSESKSPGDVEFFNTVNGIIASAVTQPGWEGSAEQIDEIMAWIRGDRKEKPGILARLFGAR